MNILELFDKPSQPRVPEVVPPPAVPTTAIVRFTSGVGADLKADALQALSIKVKPVETAEEAAKLADRRAQVKVILKNIEDRRKRTVEPLKREASAVDDEARTWADPLKKWDKDAERVLLAYQRKDADARRRDSDARHRALAQLAEDQAAAEANGDAEAAEKASTALMHVEAQPDLEPVTGYKTDAGTTFTRKTWKVEVVDPSLVPPNYTSPDPKKLQAAVDAGAREIEGCNIFEQESLVVRTR